jgi:TRAP-type mannitol/chloroaromatic compound transport system permease small subunit
MNIVEWFGVVSLWFVILLCLSCIINQLQRIIISIDSQDSQDKRRKENENDKVR